MEILEVEHARAIIVLKRSMRPGFAGVENELYYNPKCMMLFRQGQPHQDFCGSEIASH
jgi:NAD(P) transhydrogenase subunit beta